MKFKKLFSFLLVCSVCIAAFSGCSDKQPTPDTDINAQAPGKIIYDGEMSIVLSDESITYGGKKVGPQGKEVYLSNDVIYYEDRDSYESGNPYGDGTEADKHSVKQAEDTMVVNIVSPGIYRISGKLSQGQIRVDLGEDANENENAKVTLVLDGVDINCDVAPAVLFMNVYECDSNWDAETATSEVDTTNAGANIIIADGSVNNIDGSYVAKIYKDKDGEKKLWKQDGAVYSYMSMNVDGEKANSGVLNINADNEGLDTELHLTINGGNINIFADNDGINTNEDGVSVTTINGGNVHILAGLGKEGDGIDSNGWLVINGGTVVSHANPTSDAGLDSDTGSFVNGGTVVALGSTMDWAESDSNQVTMNLQFAQYENSDEAIIVTKPDGTVVFAYDPSEDEVAGSKIRKFMGAVISCPEFEVNETYNVYIGGTVNGSEIAGVYDITTVTGFEGAVLQQYTGSDLRRFPGHIAIPENFEPGNMPEKFDGERPESPEGFNPGDKPDKLNGERPEPPEGFKGEAPQQPNDFKGEAPQPPEGFEPPDGIPKKEFFQNNNGENVADGQNPSTEFFMIDKVNSFSGISDYLK